MAHKELGAICLKIKTRVLPTFLRQKVSNIELNTQFYPKNVGKTHVFIFEQMALEILRAFCPKIKHAFYRQFLNKIAFWQKSFCVFS